MKARTQAALAGFCFVVWICNVTSCMRESKSAATEPRTIALGLREVQAAVEMAWTAGKTGKSLEWTTNAVVKIFEYATADIAAIKNAEAIANEIVDTPAITNLPAGFFTTNREPEDFQPDLELLTTETETNIVLSGDVTISDEHRTLSIDPMTNLLNKLIADDTFCKVRGHTWGAHVDVTMEYNPSATACRECKVCGLHQERYEEWR